MNEKLHFPADHHRPCTWGYVGRGITLIADHRGEASERGGEVNSGLAARSEIRRVQHPDP